MTIITVLVLFAPTRLRFQVIMERRHRLIVGLGTS
jgi:hypothetical protein